MNNTLVPEQEKILKEVNQIVVNYKASNGMIRAHFFLTGPSGSGKSHLVNQLALEHDLQMIEINAAQITKEGMSGNSLSKCLTPLLNRQGQLTIVFVDEFDKLFISGNSNSELANEVTVGVQNEFLKILESSSTQVFGDYGKYLSAPVDDVLFVFAGAFNGEENMTIDRLRDFGIKTEFLGRVGLVYSLEKLSKNSMWSALINHKLLKQYSELYGLTEEQKLQACHTIWAVIDSNYDKNTVGIRILTTLLHKYFVNNGKLEDTDVKRTTFQKKLSFQVDGKEIYE